MDSKIKILIGILVMVIILVGGWWIGSSRVYPETKEVTINTDKEGYELGEVVKITVLNGLSKSINFSQPFQFDGTGAFVERYISNGKWERLNVDYAVLGIVMPIELKPSEKYEFEWDQKIIGSWPERHLTTHGKHRIGLIYRGTKGLVTVYSNEFVIKPKEDVTVTTDKTEYEQGEGITVTIKNTLDKSIWYIKEICPPSCCNLYRWEENQWKNLGDPTPCVQLIPPPPGKPYYIEPDELKPIGSITKQWDMIMGGKTAESGKYRFSFYYGLSKDNYTEKTIYSNEFTIKDLNIQKNPQTDCLGSCRCMKECNEKGPTYFIPADDGSSECSVNSINKICCCSGV